MSGFVETLDDLGRPAWIALMVVGFFVFPPAGLAVLAYLLWSGRMACGSRWADRGPGSRWERKMQHFEEKMQRWQQRGERMRGSFSSGYSTTGNRAFDEYRSATMKRLEEEFDEFKAFLSRLREAKDKSEFEQFMTERRNRPEGGPERRDRPQSGPTPPIEQGPSSGPSDNTPWPKL